MMANAGESNIRKMEREPITLVCLVVFLLASVAVVGTYVDAQYIRDNTVTVQSGDSVTLDYTGSLYGYYDAGAGGVIPMIFDTSVASIGKNKDYHFTTDLTGKTFESPKITLGKYTFLKSFENELMGKKVGETVRFGIPAEQAYPGVDTNKADSAGLFDTVYEGVKLDDLKSFFGITDAPGSFIEYKGMTIQVTKVGSVYSLTYLVNAGDVFELSENALGKLKMKIDGVDSGKATCSFIIENPVKVKDADGADAKIAVGGTEYDEIEMLSLKAFYGNTLNIIGYDGTKIVYNSNTGSAQINNMYLYFVVKILSKN